jgi:serine/threonine-protein kinase
MARHPHSACHGLIRMTPENWERLQIIFDEAISLAEDDRPQFLISCCRGEPELLAVAERMVEENSRADSILHRGLPNLAQRMIAATRLESLASQTIGSYHLLRLLGKGGMGVVYLAERTDTGKQVAMKFLQGAGMSPARRALFTREIKTHAKVSHPCIAAQYDAGMLPDGTPWFVMEYVEGQHLLEYFEQKQSSLVERLSVFRALSVALEYLHRKGIIHSDLKPSNILIDHSGTPKLLDFGIAKELQLDDNPRFAVQMMTRAYAAPEWIETGVVDHSTDVYSLGLIFSEMLPGALSKTARRELEKIRTKATAPDPAKRYQSVEALRRDIDHFLSSEPLEGVPGNRWYRLERFTSRHQNAAIAGSLAFLLFSGVVTFFTVRLSNERNVALAEVRRTKLVEQFLFNLFQGGDKDAGPATDVRALTLVGRGEQEAEGIAHDPPLQAEFYGVVGRIYQQLGQLDKADKLLSAALKQRYSSRAKEGDIADGLLALGSLRIDQGRLADAARIVRKALALRKAESPVNELALAKTEALMGRVSVEQGHYDEGIALLQDAERIQTPKLEAQRDLAATVVGLSDAYFDLSNYTAADPWVRRALSLHQKLNGQNHPLVAIDLRNLGNIDYQTGRYPEAEKYFRQALAIDQSWYGKDHPETADMEVYVAQAMIRQGRLAAAEPLMQQAALAIERAYPPLHPRVALALNELGTLFLQEGKLDEAESTYSRALEIYEKTLGPTHQQTTVARNNLVSVYLKQKRYPEAEAGFSQVLAILLKDNLGDGFNAGVTRIKLGRTFTREGKYKEALLQLNEGCRIITQHSGPSSEWIKAIQPDLTLIKSKLKTQ